MRGQGLGLLTRQLHGVLGAGRGCHTGAIVHDLRTSAGLHRRKPAQLSTCKQGYETEQAVEL